MLKSHDFWMGVVLSIHLIIFVLAWIFRKHSNVLLALILVGFINLGFEAWVTYRLSPQSSSNMSDNE